MRLTLAGRIFLVIVSSTTLTFGRTKDRDNHEPVAWCYLQKGPVELMPKTMGRRKGLLSLGRGTLAPVLKTESKNGKNRALVRVPDLSTLEPVEGWVDSSDAEIIPADHVPSDQELLPQLGSEYREDFAATKVTVARWLVKQGASREVLVCFVASLMLPNTRLVAFLPGPEGSLIPGPSLDFPFSDMKPGIVSAEVRDLFGDRNECFITHEPFRKGPQLLGVNVVIRRLEGGNFRSLWAAPVEYRNLESFPARLEILHPPEKNIGVAGTVTKGDVDFEQRGRISIPVWKGTVDFSAVGQDKPLKSVKIVKACTWDGSEFEPLQ